MCHAQLFKYMICRHFSPNVLWTHCEGAPAPALGGPAACPHVRKVYWHVADLCWRCKEAWRVTTVAPPAANNHHTEWFWCVGREDYSGDFEVDRDDWAEAALEKSGAGGAEEEEEEEEKRPEEERATGGGEGSAVGRSAVQA